MSRTAPTQREDSIRVLHVDDETDQLEFAKTFIMFSDPAIHMESAPTPKEALDRLRDESFDCIVSDYQMPGMDGIELARRIRETSDVPIIIYTGRGSEEVAEAAFTVGIDDYIRKEMNPSHYQVLAKRIRTAVEKKRAENKEIRERDKAQNYFDIAGVILVALDAEGKISLLNQKGAQVLGISPEEAQGKDWYGSFLPARKEGDVRQNFKEMMKGNLELVESVENAVVTTSGEERIIAWKNTVLRDDEDNIIGTLSSGEDITERKRAELALEASEEKFRVLTEKSVIGIYIIQDFKMAYVNPSLAKTFGYSTDEIIGILSPQDLVHADDLDILRRRITERLDDKIKESSSFYRAMRKDGSPLFIETFGVLIEYQGRPAVMGTLLDVTERMRMETELRESEEKYRRVLESSMEAITIVSDGIIVYANQRFVDLLGYDELSEVLGKESTDLVHPEDRELLTNKQNQRKAGDSSPFRYECRYLRKDGSIIIGEVQTTIMEYEGKRATLGFTRDMTEPKRMEETLVTLHRHASELEKCKNDDEVYAVVLSAMEHTLGFDRVDVLMVEGDMLKQVAAHESLPWGLELPLDGKGLTVKAIRERKSVLANDVGANEDYIFIADPSGEHLRTRAELLEDYPSSKSELAVPIIVDDEAVGVLNVESLRRTAFTEQDRILLEILANHVASVIGRTRKVSELGKAIEDRELAEQELLEYTETLSEAVEEKTREVLDLERMSAAGKVAAMVGHDLRGPLQTIKNSLYLLERNPEEGAELRKSIDEAVNYAASMLEELRLNIGDTPLQLQEVNLGALIRKVVDEASIPDSVEAEVHVDDGLGSVSMDPLKIRRVLDNLVRNAVEAMPDGGTLGVSAVCDGDVVFIRVRDTGTGIPEDLMPDLFKAFVTTKPQGMGLGLAYCKRAVEAHGGTIVIESKAGEGTTIILKIPTETS